MQCNSADAIFNNVMMQQNNRAAPCYCIGLCRGPTLCILYQQNYCCIITLLHIASAELHCMGTVLLLHYNSLHLNCIMHAISIEGVLYQHYLENLSIDNF